MDRAAGSQGVFLNIPHDRDIQADPPYILAGQADEDPSVFYVVLYLDGANGDTVVEGSLADCRKWLKAFDSAAVLEEIEKTIESE